jgi:hypothetical protein
MMRYILKILFVSNLLFFPYLVFAQGISNDIIGSTGEYDENSSVSLSWTIGENIVETMANNSITLSNGFQQGDLTVSTIINNIEQKYEIQVYPNPIETMLTINSKEYTLDYSLVNSNGQTLKKGLIDSNLTTLDFSDYPSGLYILILNREDVYKIIKH